MEPTKVIKDFRWVVVSQGRREWNEIYIDFHVPSHESSVKKPLPKNTGLEYEPPPIKFSYRLVHRDPSFKMVLSNVNTFLGKATRKVGDFLMEEVERELKKHPQIVFLTILFYPDFIDFKSETGQIKLRSPSDEVEFPIRVSGYLRGELFSLFRPPIDSTEAVRFLLEVKELLRLYTMTEMEKSFREYFNNIGFVVEDFSASVQENPERLIVHAPRFSYLPRTLEEWMTKETHSLHFVVIFPKLKELITSFINTISSCETITELSDAVLLYISMFRDKTRVLRAQVSPSDSRMMWLISAESNEENDVLSEDAYPFLRNTFIWVKNVVEGNNPSQTEQLTSDNNPIENRVGP